MELTIITNRPTFINKSLERATQLLINCDSQIKNRQYDIAAILAEIEVKQYYKDDGFANCAEYAQHTFGMKKTTAYDLIAIGTEYIRPILNANGKAVGHCSNLLPPANTEKQDAPIYDFTPRQLAKLKTLGREKVLKLIEDGEVKPQMTFRELSDVVKLHTAKPAEVSEEPAEQPTQEPAEPAEQPKEEEAKREPLHITFKRGAEWDNVGSDILIAELRARGFTVSRGGVEQLIDW